MPNPKRSVFPPWFPPGLMGGFRWPGAVPAMGATAPPAQPAHALTRPRPQPAHALTRPRPQPGLALPDTEAPTAPEAPPATSLAPQYLRPTDRTPARTFGRWGWATYYMLDPANYGQDSERQYSPPGPQLPVDLGVDVGDQGAGGGGGGGGGGWTVPAPAGVDDYWYAEFQRQHGGMTPEQYYAQTNEGLEHALADEEWARGFAEMYGRPPNEYDWRAHWFSTRVGYTPEEYDEWKMEQIARRVQSEGKGEKEKEERPPLYQPPFVVWR